MLPIVVNAQDVQDTGVRGALSNISADHLVLVDLSSAEAFDMNHISGAHHLPYASIVRSEPPIGGLLPDPDSLSRSLNAVGIGSDSWVVAYDQNGGAAASRLIWTLHAFGFDQCSLLNGGLQAWTKAGFASSDQPPAPVSLPAQPAKLTSQRLNVVDSTELLQRMNRGEEFHIIDARSRKEFLGQDKRSEKAGRIPGAKWQEWTDLLEGNGDQQIIDAAALEKRFSDIGVSVQTKERQADDKRCIVVYCQTHQRSSLTYVVLKHLGFTNVLGLEGAWSAWGNRDDTPIEI